MQDEEFFNLDKEDAILWPELAHHCDCDLIIFAESFLSLQAMEAVLILSLY